MTEVPDERFSITPSEKSKNTSILSVSVAYNKTSPSALIKMSPRFSQLSTKVLAIKKVLASCTALILGCCKFTCQPWKKMKDDTIKRVDGCLCEHNSASRVCLSKLSAEFCRINWKIMRICKIFSKFKPFLEMSAKFCTREKRGSFVLKLWTDGVELMEG